MKCKLFLTLILALLAVVSSAQTRLRGNISVEYEEAAASFCNITVYELADSVATVTRILTDLNGDYAVDMVSAGNYAIDISFYGCRPLSDTILISTVNPLAEIVRNYKLQPDAQELTGITVNAYNIRQGIDKTTFNITSDDIATYNDALQLTKKVPSLSVDPVTQRIRSMNDGGVKILLNGANATEFDLQSITSDQVKAIEFYDFPPARFAGYGAVINIRTKSLTNGYSGGINLQHAVTTGFANDGAYFNYVFGDNKISFAYNVGYRNYADVQTDISYRYDLSNREFIRNERQKRKFGYTDNYITIAYLHEKEDNYQFQVDFHPNFRYVHDKGENIINTSFDNVSTDRYGRRKSKTNQFSPYIDMYYWKQLKNDQEIIVDVVGTYYKATDRYSNQEFLVADNSNVIDDFKNTDNNKYSIIGEFNYFKSFGQHNLSIGNRAMWEDLRSSVENTFGNNTYDTKILSDYLYAEMFGELRKVQYRVTLGGNIRHSENYLGNETNFVFQPDVMLKYPFTEAWSIQSGVSQINTSPSLAQLSNNPSLVDENIISVGNPSLKNGWVRTGFLRLNYVTTKLTFYLTGRYQYMKRPVNLYFVEESPNIYLRYENAKNAETMTFSYVFSYNPFPKNLLILKVAGSVVRNNVNSVFAGKYHYTSFPFNYEVNVNYKGFSAFYQGNITHKTLNGPYLTSNEKISNIGIGYTKGNWTGSLMCMWFLTDAKYNTKTIPDSIVDYDFTNNIKDNSNMITLGISYRFSSGRKGPEGGKYFDNKDTDSGLN